MLAISPRYMLMFATAGSISGMLLLSTTLFVVTLVVVRLKLPPIRRAAYLLSGPPPARIDIFGQRRDVINYL